MSANLGNSQLAKARLSEAVERGLEAGRRVIPRILNEVPQDEIQAAKQTALVLSPGVARYRTRLGESPITEYALRQLCERVGGTKFAAYALEQLELSKPPARDGKRLAAGELQEDENPNAWRAENLERLAREHFEHAGGRYLIRRLGGEVRGVLSDTFRRLDCRPMLAAFLEAAQKWGGKPAGGELTETRAVVRILIPKIHEIRPGEFVVYGMQYGNSDFGAGSYSLTYYLLRLLCLNGMTGEKTLTQIHLGKRLSEDIELSAHTHELDTKTLVSATIDTVGYLLSDEVLDKRTKAIGELAGVSDMPVSEALRRTGKRLSKKEEEAATALYEGPDKLNLPEGNNLWRWANALSFLANDEKEIPNPDRRIELQEIAGRLLPQDAPRPRKPTGKR